MLAAPLGFDISMILIRPRARTFHRTVDFIAGALRGLIFRVSR